MTPDVVPGLPDQIGLYIAGGVVLMLAVQWIRGLAKRDSAERDARAKRDEEERAELKARLSKSEEVQHQQQQQILGLTSETSECRTHRVRDREELDRLWATLGDVQRKQAERLALEGGR